MGIKIVKWFLFFCSHDCQQRTIRIWPFLNMQISIFFVLFWLTNGGPPFSSSLSDELRICCGCCAIFKPCCFSSTVAELIFNDFNAKIRKFCVVVLKSGFWCVEIWRMENLEVLVIFVFTGTFSAMNCCWFLTILKCTRLSKFMKLTRRTKKFANSARANDAQTKSPTNRIKNLFFVCIWRKWSELGMDELIE